MCIADQLSLVSSPCTISVLSSLSHDQSSSWITKVTKVSSEEGKTTIATSRFSSCLRFDSSPTQTLFSLFQQQSQKMRTRDKVNCSQVLLSLGPIAALSCAFREPISSVLPTTAQKQVLSRLFGGILSIYWNSGTLLVDVIIPRGAIANEAKRKSLHHNSLVQIADDNIRCRAVNNANTRPSWNTRRKGVSIFSCLSNTNWMAEIGRSKCAWSPSKPRLTYSWSKASNSAHLNSPPCDRQRSSIVMIYLRWQESRCSLCGGRGVRDLWLATSTTHCFPPWNFESSPSVQQSNDSSPSSTKSPRRTSWANGREWLSKKRDSSGTKVHLCGAEKPATASQHPANRHTLLAALK
jgi:hypothetical protein